MLPDSFPQFLYPCCTSLLNRRSSINGTIYVGVTSNLPKRVWEHKHKVIKGFTSKYNVDKLVYYEFHETAQSAIIREKQLNFGKGIGKRFD